MEQTKNSYRSMTETEIQRWQEIMDANGDMVLEALARHKAKREKEEQSRETKSSKAGQKPTPSMRE